MLGQTLSHYRIVEKIGAGGMGEVYKAHDERLDRDVAIKVLPADTLTDEHSRKRFRKEALALSKLNHPNIATVHDFDTREEIDFIVMEYVEGASLAEKLKTGPLSEKEAGELGAQIADALEEAHERGIVHRDLKPGNIAVTPKGRVKVLDFGLARMLRPVSDEVTTEALTEEHAVGGTLPYMSPEELRGERADHRSDLYSFGVVLYEMATGRRPHEHTLSTALADAIIHRPPEPPSSHNRKISPALESIIIKALDKDPEHRYQSAREMRVDLERLSAPAPRVVPKRKTPSGRWFWAAAAAVAIAAVVVALMVFMRGGKVPKIDSVAVLPLENLSGDPDQEYFADGMTEELIAELSKIDSLRVISRQSVMQFKDTITPLPAIAQALNVDALVEGSVRRSGGRVRITTQLIQANPERHLWAESYERDMKDILTLQSEVASAITREIRTELTSQEEARPPSTRTVDADAYDAYFRGRFFREKTSPEGFQRAIECFNEAIKMDPDFAPAYAGLADTYNLLGVFSILPMNEASSESRAAALKALEIDETLAEAHASLGKAKRNDWDWAGAEAEFQRAFELNHSNAAAHEAYGRLLSLMGRSEAGILEVKRSLELNPVSYQANAALGLGLYRARQYDSSIEQLKRTLELHPTVANGHQLLAWPYLCKSMYEEAIAAAHEAIRIGGRQTNFLGALGCGYAMAGKKSDALSIGNELRSRRENTHVDAGFIGLIYASLGDRDEAMRWFDKAYEERSTILTWVKAPLFDHLLRDDTRFQDLVRRMNFPE